MIQRSRFFALILLGLVMSFPLAVGLSVFVVGENATFLLFSLLVTALALWSVKSGFSRRKWPTTTATVTESSFTPGKGLFGWRDPDSDRVLVRYTYTVESETFSKRLDAFSQSENVTKAFGGIPREGATVEVHYNPADPSKSVLVAGPGSITLVFLILGIGGVTLACFLMWRGL